MIKNMKIKKVFVLILSCVCICVLAGCDFSSNKNSSGKLKIMTTLFPQYDFAKQIAKDKAEVKLLLPPGVESHTFEPTAADVISINESDVFLYTGKYMEPWVENIIAGSIDSDVKVKDVSSGIELMKTEHDDDEDGNEHDHTYDPHIWLDLSLACKIVDNIKSTLCEVDPANADYYESNAKDYKSQLMSLDQEFSKAVQGAKHKSIVFGGRFAHAYFVKRYGLRYETAYHGCSAESEPSLQSISEIMKFIKDNRIPCVYYEEFSEPKVAKSIASQTGVKLLQFTTAHNVTKDQIEKNVLFLDIMRENLKNLKVGLGYDERD